MRYAALLVLLAAFVGTAGAQTLAEAARTDGEREVIHAVKSGELEGHFAGILGYMGDAAAVSITKALGGKVPTNDEMETASWILGRAFWDVSFVEKVSDRKPETAFFILRYFETIATDPQLRKDLQEAKQTILEHTKSATN
jgi:hypothetical protein